MKDIVSFVHLSNRDDFSIKKSIPNVNKLKGFDIHHYISYFFDIKSKDYNGLHLRAQFKQNNESHNQYSIFMNVFPKYGNLDLESLEPKEGLVIYRESEEAVSIKGFDYNTAYTGENFEDKIEDFFEKNKIFGRGVLSHINIFAKNPFENK
ncbi:MAG: hypothetical protein PF542_03470 [Nanoarchaeota archaeon]|jgi:hypothetical protein|nr:hypothetical protein [Nanoarchaeota archaeon]